MNYHLVTRKEAEDIINAFIVSAWLLTLITSTRAYVNNPTPMALFTGVFSMIALIMKPDVKIVRED